MAKGSKIVPVRIPVLLLLEICQAIDETNKRRNKQTYSVSSWIRQAACEKLKHLRRSKRYPRSKKDPEGGCITPPFEGDFWRFQQRRVPADPGHD